MSRHAQRVKIVELNEVYNSITAAARAVQGDQGAVTRVLKGERKQHKGYTFVYDELRFD